MYQNDEIQGRKLEKVIFSKSLHGFYIYKNFAFLAEAKYSYFCAYSRLRILILVNILRL